MTYLVIGQDPGYQLLDPLMQWLGLQETPLITPQLKPAADPQTEAKLRNWTPEDLAEAQAQRGKQYASDVAYQQQLHQADDSSGGEPPAPLKEPDWLLWAAMAIAIGAVLKLAVQE